MSAAFDPNWRRLKVRWASTRGQRASRVLPAAFVLDLLDELESQMAHGASETLLAACTAREAIDRIAQRG